MSDIYILGGYQSDFSRNLSREGVGVFELFSETVRAGLEQAKLDAADIEVGHVANFESSLYTRQSHLGGFFGHVDPAMTYMPASRHEAACASGSMAILAAMSDLESKRYRVACVLGLEVMKTTNPEPSNDRLKGAAWVGQEWQSCDYVWPSAFSDLIDVYQRKHGVDKAHLAAISQKNFANARRNPNAQSRSWSFDTKSFTANDESNPQIAGNIRRLDCGQVTDGAAVVFLATEEAAAEYASAHGVSLDSIPKITGWGHVNAPMLFDEKVRLSEQHPHVLPHVGVLFEQTLQRAGLANIQSISGLEVHDCFNITEYMILDHAGISKPGEVWQAVEAGMFETGGALPVNASGGLIGLGHPVGATGVRMLLDSYKQVSMQAGDTQIPDATNMMTFNLGGSATTCASFVVSA